MQVSLVRITRISEWAPVQMLRPAPGPLSPRSCTVPQGQCSSKCSPSSSQESQRRRAREAGRALGTVSHTKSLLVALMRGSGGSSRSW
jgi:hypothetical protein